MTNSYKAVVLVPFFLIQFSFTNVRAQTYFAGTGAGTGNIGIRVTGVGYNALSSANSGNYNTAFGYQALKTNTTGTDNTAIGSSALGQNTTGFQNAAIGSFVLSSNTSGKNNTGGGYASLTLNTTGSYNVALGHSSLLNNSVGNSNTAVGTQSLQANTIGDSNVAIGYSALRLNTEGNTNTAVGTYALENNTIESNNTAVGFGALRKCSGFANNATGSYALGNGTSSSSNNAYGYAALYNNTGNSNNGFGYNALYFNTTGSLNVAMGMEAGMQSTSVNNSVFIGAYSDASVNGLTNAVAIGYNAKVNVSNKVVIGNTAITSIGGQVGWTTYSDQRLKTNVCKSKIGLDFILSLNPVTYNYKAEGQKEILYTGLIAQEVDAAAKKSGVEFSGVDKNGDYWGIRYAELTVPLIRSMQELNEKTQAENEQLKTRIEKLEAAIELLQQDIKPSTVISSSILFQNQPNPFDGTTIIGYLLSSTEKNASLVIRNINGAVLKQINNLQLGKGRVNINSKELAAGTYTYSLVVNGNITDTKIMVITK